MKYKRIFLSQEYFSDQFTYPLRPHAKLKNAGKRCHMHCTFCSKFLVSVTLTLYFDVLMLPENTCQF